MKIYTTLSLSLVVVSLLGCNSLATKPNPALIGAEEPAAYENQATDSPVNESLKPDETLSGFETWHSSPFSTADGEKSTQSTEVPPLYPDTTEVSKPSAISHTRTEKTSDQKTRWANKPRANKKGSSVTTDLWVRIRQRYGLPAIDNSQIQSFLDKFVNHPPYFKRITGNAQPYLYHIVEELEKRGMPLEIALLPAIESAYEPLAVSYKSAAGLWQFMPATGEDYGLKQNYWYDGRRDIISSTTGALDYLQRLHQLFDGDWLRALAAYNYGEGNLTKAIDRNKALNRATDFWSLKLPRETREYVPKLLALSKIVANPQKYGIELQAIANKPYFKRVNVGRQIDLSLAAQLAGLSKSELKRLNPAYRRGVTAPGGPHYVTLPVHSVRQFRRQLAAIPPQKLLAQTSVPKPQLHIVKRGQHLTMIAKRYGMTVAELRWLNKLKGGPLYVGKRLKVRAYRTQTQTARAKTLRHKVRRGENLTMIANRYGTTVAELRRLNKLKGGPLYVGKRLKVRASKTQTQTARAQTQKQTHMQRHKVRRGENLSMIANRYGMTVAELRRLNKLKGGPLYVGKRLKVRAYKTQTQTQTARAKTQMQKHKVRRGENLTVIAKRYGTTVSLLRKWNNIKGKVLKFGQTLKVPTTLAILQKSAKTSKKRKIIHRVKSGESLGSLARRYKVSVKKLAQWNRLKKDQFLLKGQKLTIWVNN